MADSEFTLAGVATELGERLTTALAGTDIGVRNVDVEAPTNQLAVLLTFEQLGVSTDHEGQRLAAGWVSVAFNLVLAAPEPDPLKGTARVFENLPALCRVLDAMDDLVWSTADKGRDSSGTFYSAPITVFAHYPAPDDGANP